MAGFLRQATASQARALGPFLDDTDFKTPETGLTIANTDIKIVMNGSASADKNSGGGTHRVNGVYGFTFDATDTATVGEMEVSVLVSGALIVFDKFTVVEEAVYDSQYAASAPGYVVDQPVNTTKFGGTTVTARDIGSSVLLSSGTGTGQIKIASGYVAPDWGDVANKTTTNALTGTTISTSQVVASVTGAVGSVTGAVGSVTGNVGGNVTGSVGSVVGAVGSVTGNVGGNVTGSVGSVVGAVGSVTGNVGGNVTGSVASVVGNVGGNVVGSVGSVTGEVTANVTKISGDATAADNAESFFDGTGYAGTNNVIPMVTVTTTATNLTTNNDKTGYRLSATGVDDILDEVIEGTTTLRQSMRLANSANGAEVSGAATTTVNIRDLADTKNRVVATVDSDGNRTAVTLDLT